MERAEKKEFFCKVPFGIFRESVNGLRIGDLLTSIAHCTLDFFFLLLALFHWTQISRISLRNALLLSFVSCQFGTHWWLCCGSKRESKSVVHKTNFKLIKCKNKIHIIFTRARDYWKFFCPLSLLPHCRSNWQ